MELLAHDKFSAHECEEIFMVGLFSLVDVLFHVPLAQVLDRITLPSEVTDALLYNKGSYAAYLQLGVAIEEADQSQVDVLSAQLGLELHQVDNNQVEALKWVMQQLEEIYFRNQ